MDPKNTAGNGGSNDKVALQPLTKTSQILSLKKITPEDLKPLDANERADLQMQVSKILNSLTGQALVDYVEKVEAIIPGRTDLRNQVYEINHAEISRHMHNYLLDNSRPPTLNELADLTGLSRQTVAAHLKDFPDSEFSRLDKNKFRRLSSRILSRLYVNAREGNVKAARLFFEMTGELSTARTNNFYILINNVRVNQSIISRLPQDALAQIETIINSSLTKKL